jgi:ATP-binding cassette subfamily C protein LapB
MSNILAHWVAVLEEAAQFYHLPISREVVRQYSALDGASDLDRNVEIVARQLGLSLEFEPATAAMPGYGKLPLIAELHDDSLLLITALTGDGEVEAVVAASGAAGDDKAATDRNRFALGELLPRIRRYGVARPARAVPDARVDTYIQPFEEHWLRRIIMRDIKFYPNILLASLVANVLALGSVIFSMQVYDRVVPAQSYPTLYVLFSGVILALLFEFMMRRTRMTLSDVLGKRADLTMSDRVFGHALRIKGNARPTSTGSFLAQLRDMEQVREMLTSTTIAAVADLPFFLLFLVLFWYIAGVLVLVPLAALLLLIVPGVLMQRKLHEYAKEGMREASLRNAMLIEAVQRIDDVKMLQAEARFENQWNHANEVTSASQLKLRGLTNSLTVWTQTIQTSAYATIVFFGAPMVMGGDMTTGALVGASILGSRMLAPLSQITQVLTRLQHAKVGIGSLNGIMAMPTDSTAVEQRIAVPHIKGDYKLRGASFRYGDAQTPVVLQVENLHIKAGERVALLGRNGAGKSTLLQGLAGLLEPAEGEMLLDDITLRQIDPADVRHGTGLVAQSSGLFHGTIRDNLVMGARRATDAQIIEALQMVGADEFITRLPNGLAYPVTEGGKGLSGGQVQALLLARMLIRNPQVVLLDEPTAAMDEAVERHFLHHFRRWSEGKTVVLATHRMKALDLVDRIIVLQHGRVVLDDKRDAAIAAMRGGVAA